MNRGAHAFTIKELAAVLAIILSLGFIVLIQLLPPGRRYGHHHEVRCVNNLKNIGLAFRIYATDNNDQFPGSFLLSNRTSVTLIPVWQVYAYLSNELSTPTLLLCPQDAKREPAKSFGRLLSTNISYFASLNAAGNTTNTFLAGDRNLEQNGRPLTGVFPLKTNTPLSWSRNMHRGQGNVALCDGSVQALNNGRLAKAIEAEDVATNLVAMP